MKKFARSAGIRVLLMTVVVSAVLLMFSNRVDAAGNLVLSINPLNFPDDNFRYYISRNCDSNRDGNLGRDELLRITEMFVYDMDISDLRGIEYFSSLTTLKCYNNKLTKLDVSKNTKLQWLECYENQLTTLNVSKNTRLQRLECYNNQLTSLDLSNNTELQTLDCKYNNLSELDLSNNTKLNWLMCTNNQLKTLNVSNCSVLKYIYCTSNQLATLDISKNTILNTINCDHNQLTSIDVSNNTVLDRLDFEGNKISAIDVSKNLKLRLLFGTFNGIKTIDVSNNTSLEDLSLYGNLLTTIDVSKNTALKSLNVGANHLTTIDVSNNPSLTYLDVRYNYFTSKPVVDSKVSFYYDEQYEKPAITTQPKDYTGFVDDTAVFTVNASGNWMHYQWQTYIDGAWKNSSLPGSDTNTLSVPITKARDGYKFRCVASDSNNMKVKSKTVTLHVIKTASITTQPKDYTGTVGSTAKFTVAAEGPGLKYQWQTYVNGAWKDSSLTGAKTATLSVPVTKARDGYKFRCVVTDSYGKTATSKAVTLHVNVPVTLAITTQPKNYTGPVGSTATFKVKAQGTGLKYQWQTYKNGKWVNSSLTGATTTTLTVPVTKARDGYMFRCVVTDASGNRVACKSVTLRVG